MRATLLLADDSVTIQRVTELTFANEDVRVATVSDGQAALSLIDSEQPDIVLADVSLPKVDGYGVASHIKQSPELKEIPVVLLTGAFEPIDDEKARECGCDSVLVKPFEPQQLIACVRELLTPKTPPPQKVDSAPNNASASPLSVLEGIDEPMLAAAPIAIDPSARPAASPLVFTPFGDDPDFDLDLRPFEAAFVRADPIMPGAGSDRFSRAVAEGNGAGKPIDGAPSAPAASARASFEDWDSPNTFSGNGSAEHFSGGSDTADSLAAPPPPEETRSSIEDHGPSPSDPVQPKPAASESDRPSIASAFSALLAGEQAAPARFSHPLPSISDAAIEQVVHRVLARMTEESVRKIVLENAERIIREEIERIKAK
jgi:CheY-like chemotaxis protein